jgi:hypothetical protein
MSMYAACEVDDSVGYHYHRHQCYILCTHDSSDGHMWNDYTAH